MMDDYLDRDFDAAFLDSVRDTFTVARDNGLKTSLRFLYNFNQDITDRDASLAQRTRHLQQLKPIFQANEDVFGFAELGFIGRFGEWQNSTSGHVAPGTVDLTPSGVGFAQAILDNTPESRMVSARYVKQYGDVFGSLTSATEADARQRNDRARLAISDHAIAFDGEDSVGTFDPDPTVRAQEQAFLEAHTEYTISAGEPFANSEYFQDNIIDYGERFHLAVLSVNQGDAVDTGLYDELRANGKYDELDRRLGYRYRLETVATEDTAEDELTLDVSIANDGFARPFNERDLELVLRGDDGGFFRIDVDATDDLRLLLPGGGEKEQLSFAFDLTGVTAGEYDLLLNLPDPFASLENDPRYSIRLANEGVWEAATGFNDLGLRVTVVPEPTAATALAACGLLLRRRSRRAGTDPSEEPHEAASLLHVSPAHARGGCRPRGA